jgi:prepilin peptidase CpaA
MPWPLYTFIFIELVLVTYIDIKHRKIANLWSFLNILVAATAFILFPNIYPFSFDTFEFSIVFIFVGFLLFMLKVMGGGDSKFLASFFLIVPLNHQDQVFYQLLISTIIIGVIFLMMNTISNRKLLMQSMREKDILGVKSCFGTKFAYAPVILVTWILFGKTLIEEIAVVSLN